MAGPALRVLSAFAVGVAVSAAVAACGGENRSDETQVRDALDRFEHPPATATTPRCATTSSPPPW